MLFNKHTLGTRNEGAELNSGQKFPLVDGIWPAFMIFTPTAITNINLPCPVYKRNYVVF